MRKWTWADGILTGTGPCEHGEETVVELEPWHILNEAECQFIVDALNAAEERLGCPFCVENHRLHSKAVSV